MRGRSFDVIPTWLLLGSLVVCLVLFGGGECSQGGVAGTSADAAGLGTPGAVSGEPTGAGPLSATYSRQRPWVSTVMSHYGTCTYVNASRGCDGYLGQRTACGKVVRRDSMFVAALQRGLAHCGMRITVRYRGRVEHVRVQDSGAWRSDGRALDATHGLRRALHMPDLAHVQFRKGW